MKTVTEGNYIAIDLETTGLNPKTDSIIEIGAVKVENGRITASFETFVKPCVKVSARITQLTGITQTDVENAPFPEEKLPELLEFLGELPLLGHSVLFDYSFLKRAAVNHGLDFEKEGIDTLRIARRYLPELESRSLPFLCAHFQIPHQAHRALEDARAAHLLYLALAERFGEADAASGIHSFAPSPLCCRVKRETPATARQKERLYALIDRHKPETDYDVERLSRNQASRYIDLILAEYAQCAGGKRSAETERR